MSVYQRRIQQLRVRIAMSGVLYVAFLVSVFTMGGPMGERSQSEIGIMLLLVLSAMLLLPRSAMPSGRVAAPKNDEEADLHFMERSQLKRMEQLALWVRLGYFFLALFSIYAVPKLF